MIDFAESEKESNPLRNKRDHALLCFYGEWDFPGTEERAEVPGFGCLTPHSLHALGSPTQSLTAPHTTTHVPQPKPSISYPPTWVLARVWRFDFFLQSPSLQSFVTTACPRPLCPSCTAPSLLFSANLKRLSSGRAGQN